MRSLRDWKTGNSIRNTAHHQQAVLALRELQGAVAGIAPGEDPLFLQGYPALIVAAGPNGEADLEGCQYWIKKQNIDASDYADPITFSEDTTDQDLADQANAAGSPGEEGLQATPSIIPATNLTEWDEDGGTHLLATDGTVVVWIVEHDALGHDDPENLSTLKRLFCRGIDATSFFARVGASSQDGSNKRWSYAFTEVEKTGAGYGQWTDKSGGRTGTLYNLIEDQNGATGTWGNGVTSTNLVGTFDIQPIPSGTRVQVTTVVRADDNSTEYWVSYENGVDGACS